MRNGNNREEKTHDRQSPRDLASSRCTNIIRYTYDHYTTKSAAFPAAGIEEKDGGGKRGGDGGAKAPRGREERVGGEGVEGEFDRSS